MKDLSALFALTMLVLTVGLRSVSAGLCEDMEAVADSLLQHECGCNDSFCSYTCLTPDTGVAWCVNGCEYCGDTNCVTYMTAANVQDARDYDAGLWQTNVISYGYTQGPYAGLQLVLSIPAIVIPGAAVCSLRVINLNTGGSYTECGCEMYYCDDAQTIANAVVDCSAIEAGATANFCNAAGNFEIASLDGLMSAFLIPTAVSLVCDEPGRVTQTEGGGVAPEVDTSSFLTPPPASEGSVGEAGSSDGHQKFLESTIVSAILPSIIMASAFMLACP
jgi:hypothetical protein